MRYDNDALHPAEQTHSAFRNGIADTLDAYKSILKQHQASLKAANKKKEKDEIKPLIAEVEQQVEEITEALEVANQLVWLTDKFGDDGIYQDIKGLCRIATIDEVEKNQFSLTPGVYVDAEEMKDDGVDFTARMKEIHAELERLQQESNEIFAKIKSNESLLWK